MGRGGMRVWGVGGVGCGVWGVGPPTVCAWEWEWEWEWGMGGGHWRWAWGVAVAVGVCGWYLRLCVACVPGWVIELFDFCSDRGA